MPAVVKKTISIPVKLAKEIEEISSEEGRSLNDVIQEAIRKQMKVRFKKEFYQIQGYWSRKAKEKGILTEKDLKKYLKK